MSLVTLFGQLKVHLAREWGGIWDRGGCRGILHMTPRLGAKCYNQPGYCPFLFQLLIVCETFNKYSVNL